MRSSRRLAPLTFLPSLLMRGAVGLRDFSYQRGILPTERLDAPVVSIGNLTVGGAGKTPFVIHTARRLLEMGETPALLTRGYGRRAREEALIVPPGAPVADPARTLGDEPALIRRRVPEIWLGIDARRSRAGRAILNRLSRAVFVLDDGYQHRKLYRDLDVVIVDRAQPLSENRLIPGGTLREPVEHLRRAHAVVMVGSIPADGVDPLADLVRRKAPGARRFHCRQEIEAIFPLEEWLGGASAGRRPFSPETAFLVAAVGNPERFRADVRALGIEVRGVRFFRDHAWPGEGGWRRCEEEARRAGAACILTTEKDAVKLAAPRAFPVGVCVQSVRVDDESGFIALLARAVREGR